MRLRPLGFGLFAALLFVRAASAGVTNPNVSIIGQPSLGWTDAAGDPAARRITFDPGETELMLDAPLNPYARGAFVIAFAEDEVGVEEGYFVLERGLPAGLQLKGGKYRLGFGRLNLAHPHTYPFAERFGVLAAYLPGEESLNETGLQLSARVPAPGDVALTASLDVLQGDSYRLERGSSGAANDPLDVDPEAGDRAEEPRPALLGRVAAFLPAGDRSGVEFGLSATQGVNNVAAGTTTTVTGADVKAKWWTAPNAYLVVQGEAMHLEREDAGWDEAGAAYSSSAAKGTGGYLFADYNWATRYNAGVSFEQWQEPDDEQDWNRSVGAFVGLALLEETTAFRLDWRRIQAARPAGATETPEATQQLTLRVLFSMGPHKAHQF